MSFPKGKRNVGYYSILSVILVHVRTIYQYQWVSFCHIHTASTAVFGKLVFIQLDLRVSTRARKYECLRGGQLQNSGFVLVPVLVQLY